jgi:hypothetical protein
VPRSDHRQQGCSITNVGETITANSNSNHLLPNTAKPSLPAAPCSKDAAENVTAGHLHSNITIKIGAESI